MQLVPVYQHSHPWRVQPQTPETGLEAVDVMRVFPAMVFQHQVQYTKLVVPLLAALQQQQTLIQNQELQVRLLEQQIRDQQQVLEQHTKLIAQLQQELISNPVAVY